ncbi:MAG: sigma-70 family RNA polymerase sigma factor, partial [Candidatus Baltobacteraceae bacterium]
EREARRVSERLTHQLGRAPTYAELQAALVRVVGRAPLSEPIRIATLDAVDRAAPSLEEEIDRVVDSLALSVCMRELTDLERIVVVRIYIGGLDLAVVAAQLGYSTRQICRIRKEAVRKLAARYVQH